MAPEQMRTKDGLEVRNFRHARAGHQGWFGEVTVDGHEYTWVWEEDGKSTLSQDHDVTISAVLAEDAGGTGGRDG